MRPLKAAWVASLVIFPMANAHPLEAGSPEEIQEPPTPDTDSVEPSLTCCVTSFQRRLAGALPPPDPSAVYAPLAQGEMIHVFDTTSLDGGPWYVNDHTLVQAPDGSWHLFGIFHQEPMNSDTEVDFIHAVSSERDIAKWKEGTFRAASGDFALALTADRSIGETHLWAPHVVAAEGRWVMVYQGGGENDDRSSIRLAESEDLYRWTRASTLPLFEDFCVARDPMLVRRGSLWSLYYTRCESQIRRVSGVAHRMSSDLVHWSEPRMALSLGEATVMPSSGYTESPFVFERGEYHYLSVTSYPIGWDATFVYRSRDPFAFPDAPFSRVRAHAAEWVFDREGRAYVTHAGAGQRGVWISRVDLPGDAPHETSPPPAVASPRAPRQPLAGGEASFFGGLVRRRYLQDLPGSRVHWLGPSLVHWLKASLLGHV